MRIVGSAFGSRGDVEPLILLSAELRRRGHEVSVLSYRDFAPIAEEAGVPYHAIDRSARDVVRRSAAKSGESIRLQGIGRERIDREVDEQFEHLVPVAQGADLLLGSGLNAAMLATAEHGGAAARWVLQCPWVFPARDNPPVYAGPGLPRPAYGAVWAVSDSVFYTAMKPSLNRWRMKLGLRPVRRLRSPFGPWMEKHLLACDGAIAPLPASLQASVAQTAAIVSRSPAELPAEVERFLAGGEPPVYVGLGSMGVKDAAAFTSLVVEAVRIARVRAVVARGWAGLAEGDLPDGVLAVGELPFRALFPRMAAVVHHGGSGTTATASRAGVPQIVTPQILDQFHWGARVHALGLGPKPLPLRRLTAAGLAAALRHAAESTEMRERARELAAELAPLDGIALTADEVERSRLEPVVWE